MNGKISRKKFSLGLVLFFISNLHPLSAVASGELLSVKKLGTYSRSEIKEILEDYVDEADAASIPKIRSGIRYYRYRYLTTDPAGKDSVASGLLIVPTSRKIGPFPVLSYQHSTVGDRTDAPSRDWRGGEFLAVGVFFATQGYAVVLADGLGLGYSDFGYHPYLHAKTESSSARDALIAAQSLFRERNITTSGDLFLTGYSQGGHWSAALHRELDANPVAGFNLRASAPMAGAYDLSRTTFIHSLLFPGRTSGLLSGYLFAAYFRLYPGISSSVEEAVRPPYADRLFRLFSGNRGLIYAYRKLPKSPQRLFQEKFLISTFENTSHPLRLAMADNDVYDWAPREPAFFIHAERDETVAFGNAVIATDFMTRRGAPVKLIPIKGNYSHLSAFLPAIETAAQAFFPLLSQPPHYDADDGKDDRDDDFPDTWPRELEGPETSFFRGIGIAPF